MALVIQSHLPNNDTYLINRLECAFYSHTKSGVEINFTF